MFVLLHLDCTRYAKPSAIATAPPTRLFHCFNSGGKFQVRELADFGQSDFFEDDVMILDAYSELFVWCVLGSASVFPIWTIFILRMLLPSLINYVL